MGDLSSVQSNFEYILEILDTSPATSGIREQTGQAGYNKVLAEHICDLAFELCDRDSTKFDAAIQDFINLSADFISLQMELEESGKYKYSSFEETQKEVLENSQIMLRTYLNGLLLSQAFWVNHLRIFEFFIEKFCNKQPSTGKLLEVPIGTGIFLSEFLTRNKQWSGCGYDISQHSVNYAQSLLEIRLPGDPSATLARCNVFDLPESDRFDAIICGELMEHLEDPQSLIAKLHRLVRTDGQVFITAAIYAAHIDHIYLFKSAQEVRDMILPYFSIAKELVLPVYKDKSADDLRTPMVYACVAAPRDGR